MAELCHVYLAYLDVVEAREQAGKRAVGSKAR